jgi:hypothetical protein
VASMVFQYAPNRTTLDVTAVSTTWNVVAADGTLYPTLAALAAAGKRPWPALDPGTFLQYLTSRSALSTGIADGGPYGIAFNQSTPPTDTAGSRLVSGGGQTINDPGPLWNVWLRKTSGNDIIELVGGY